MLFIAKCLLLSLLQKTPNHAFIFHTACVVLYALTLSLLGKSTKNVKSVNGLRVSAVEPSFESHVVFAFASISSFFITPQSIASFPFMLSCYLHLPLSQSGNIQLMLLSLMLGVCVAFGTNETLTSFVASFFVLFMYANHGCTSTQKRWHYCCIFHSCAAMGCFFYTDTEITFYVCVTPCMLSMLHVMSNVIAAVQLRRLKNDVVWTTRISVFFTALVLPIVFLRESHLPHYKTLTVSASCGFCLGICNLWYHDFAREWLKVTLPFSVQGSHFGLSMLFYVILCRLLGYYFLVVPSHAVEIL